MYKDASALFKACIEKTYCLSVSKEEKAWLLDFDNNHKNNVKHGGRKKGVKIYQPCNESFGFTLDFHNLPGNESGKNLSRLFPFFGSSPPKKISKMCDAIIVASCNGVDYVFLTEKKTSNRGGAGKQCVNGRYFCKWLHDLCKEHGYYDKDFIYVALLIWEPRGIPNKGFTGHRRPNYPREALKERFKHCREAKNETSLYLSKYISDIEQCA